MEENKEIINFCTSHSLKLLGDLLEDKLGGIVTFVIDDTGRYNRDTLEKLFKDHNFEFWQTRIVKDYGVSIIQNSSNIELKVFRVWLTKKI